VSVAITGAPEDTRDEEGADGGRPPKTMGGRYRLRALGFYRKTVSAA
jgi:hypothetical protein